MQGPINQTQLQKQLKQKLKKINPNEPVSSLKQFIKVRPVGIRNIQIINQDLKNLQSILSKLTEKHVADLVAQLTQSESQILLDYLHRFMQYVGQENISSGNALNIQDQIVKKYGPMILIQAVSREDTICIRAKNFIV